MLEQGYQALKLDPFGAGFYELDRAETQRSIELVEAVRDAVGPDVEILVEMHGRFNPATAIDIAQQLEPFEPGWVEEPVPPENLAALKKAAEHIRIPVATGERIHARHEYRELFELQAADIIQPDITHFGGILETKKLAAWADAYYVLVAPHNVGGAGARPRPTCTWPRARPNFKIQEHFNDFAEAFVKEAAPGNPEVVDGYFALPTGPGLGVDAEPRRASRPIRAGRSSSICSPRTGIVARPSARRPRHEGMTALRGVFPIAPTPFDWTTKTSTCASQRRVLDFMIDAGVDGICILANYSEQFSLTDAEREQLTTLCLEHVAGRVPVIVTTSHYSARIAAERSQRAQTAGASMVMLMPPYHGATIRPAKPAIFEFFQRRRRRDRHPDHDPGRAGERRDAQRRASWRGWRTRSRTCSTSRSRCPRPRPSCAR